MMKIHESIQDLILYKHYTTTLILEKIKGRKKRRKDKYDIRNRGILRTIKQR
jgi:hypothetical protein